MVYVSIVLSVFLIEFVVDFLALKIFKIHYNILYLLFLQIPKICASIICLIYSNIFWLCILSKILSKTIAVIFITDSFKFKRIVSLVILEMMLLFSIGGFVWFLILCLDATMNDVFYCKIDKKYYFIIIFSIILYVFAFFKIVRCIENNKFLKRFSAKVSFSVCGKHINLYGLIDSGNSLNDPLTRLPVILVSNESLKRFLSIQELDFLFGLKCRKICCDTVSGSKVDIPIFNVSYVELRQGKEIQKRRCMIGVISHGLENGKYDCLLHRDFL